MGGGQEAGAGRGSLGGQVFGVGDPAVVVKGEVKVVRRRCGGPLQAACRPAEDVVTAAVRDPTASLAVDVDSSPGRAHS